MPSSSQRQAGIGATGLIAGGVLPGLPGDRGGEEYQLLQLCPQGRTMTKLLVTHRLFSARGLEESVSPLLEHTCVGWAAQPKSP